MSNEVIIGLLIVGLAAFVIYLVVRKKNRTVSTSERVQKLKPGFRTALGVEVRLESGATCDLQSQEAIEVGLTKAFAKARCAGYTRALLHSNYIFAVLKSYDLDSTGMPALREPDGDYDGTIYDKGDYILAAGRMYSAGDKGNIIIVPEHTFGYGHLQLTAEYEAEHVILAWNDGDEYERTKFHTEATSHPIIPECQ